MLVDIGGSSGAVHRIQMPDMGRNFSYVWALDMKARWIAFIVTGIVVLLMVWIGHLGPASTHGEGNVIFAWWLVGLSVEGVLLIWHVGLLYRLFTSDAIARPSRWRFVLGHLLCVAGLFLPLL